MAAVSFYKAGSSQYPSLETNHLERLDEILNSLDGKVFIKDLFLMLRDAGHITSSTRVEEKIYWVNQSVRCEAGKQDSPGPIHWQYSSTRDLWISIEIENTCTLERCSQEFYYAASTPLLIDQGSHSSIYNQPGFTFHFKNRLVCQKILAQVADLLIGETNVDGDLYRLASS